MRCRPAPGVPAISTPTSITTSSRTFSPAPKGWGRLPDRRDAGERGTGRRSSSRGTHGTTFGGNPLAATVANAVLAHLDAPLLAGVGERHALIVDQLNAISARYDAFSAVRGTGLLIGAELAGPLRGKAKTLTNPAAEEGLIALIAGPDVLRFAPALNIPLADIAEAFVRLDRAVARLTR